MFRGIVENYPRVRNYSTVGTLLDLTRVSGDQIF